MNFSNRKIEKKLSTRLLITLAVWVLAGFAMMIVIGFVIEKTDIAIRDWLSSRLDVIYIIYLIVGFLGIFYFYWKKPWNYLNEVVDAMETVYEKSSKGVILSEPLHDVENWMNQIKMSVVRSEMSVAQAEEKKKELVMYLAHDIRTPLTTVIGYLNLLSETPEMPEEQRKKYIGIVLNKSERLDMLIISADADKIARVFGNLLKNAAAYSDKGSEITIVAKREHNLAVVSFQNKGDTIPQEELQTMFDKFNRLDQARTSSTGGTGLGLSIAKEIIELHDGEITTKSEDRTITIIVSLPLSE
ncbi:MAG: sensor histidine kinase [Lentihominibacter sp.]|jgi:two-component system sensor histidine kinase VanS